MLVKQLAVERIVRQHDTTEARSEIMGWRVADAERRCHGLQLENNSLRRAGVWVGGPLHVPVGPHTCATSPVESLGAEAGVDMSR